MTWNIRGIFEMWNSLLNPRNSRAKPEISQSKGSPGKIRTLEERRENIISAHLSRFSLQSRYPYRVENAVRDCIQEIAEAEGQRRSAPNRQFLSRWIASAPTEYRLLADSLVPLFRNRERALEGERKTQEELAADNNFQNLRAKYAGLIAQFYEVAERKVSLRDDYGEENWDALPKEIAVVIRKIATGEGNRKYEEWKKYPFLMPKEYKKLSEFLDKSFREAHKAQKASMAHRVDFSAMTGNAFESYLMRILEKRGFTNVCGTPASGDQGADILAQKDGKKLVIQAKRYRTPVGNSAVQQVASAVRFYSADEGWVVTNSTFTKSARELAQKTGVKLIDQFELAKLARLDEE